MLETFIFLLLAAVSWNNGLAQNTITCNAGTAFTGEMSSVTCNFHKDIKAHKISISVTMVSSSPRQEEKDVLQCSWKQQSDRPECIVADGYTFNYEVSDRLTVYINSTTHDHAGVYSCHIVPPNGATVDQCTLVVKEKPISTRKSATLPHPQASSDGQKEILIANHVLLVILILLVIGAIIAYIVNKNKKALRTVVSRLRQTRRREEDDTKQNDSEKEPQNDTKQDDSEKKPLNDTKQDDSEKEPLNDTKQDDSEKEPQNEVEDSRAECETKDSTEGKLGNETQEQEERPYDDAEPFLITEANDRSQHMSSVSVSYKKKPPPPPPPKPPAAR